ncbi:MAG: amino acid-binding protein [Halothiobacillus sp. 24-54-40]|jgi:glycine cleavage system transcriptional repressor|nr:MAG: amino acid-binding protein [Halothiobacillus sp. 35-54-62]OYZ86827.1 MAG: amino acid-binding protein [Halothiobacillus sp. 24-54-40]OZA81001.1 MAG: amino acid-binding protein [Halothiobacillus sp. 39-53-45]HQS02531.1 ACT domain-containing protein [Halothiobacillus sp.]HQS29036.1 ACT domain-containing protein [Halothiobacillus sp.]
MQNNWLILTLVGEDRPGIVANITRVLFAVGAELGEAAMMRLGGQFAIMMMVRSAGSPEDVIGLLESTRMAFDLKLHVDETDASLHQAREADVLVTVHGADRAGIVAEVTAALVESGLNILDLRSDVGGTRAAPIYIMQIEGEARQGIDAIEAAIAALGAQGLSVRITPLDTVRG